MIGGGTKEVTPSSGYIVDPLSRKVYSSSTLDEGGDPSIQVGEFFLVLGIVKVRPRRCPAVEPIAQMKNSHLVQDVSHGTYMFPQYL